MNVIMKFNEKFHIEFGFEELLIIQPYDMECIFSSTKKKKKKVFYNFFNKLLKFHSWKENYTLQGHIVPWGGIISSLLEYIEETVLKRQL